MRITNFIAAIIMPLSVFLQSDNSNQTIKEILSLPEEQINIGKATLTLAKDFYPEMKMEVFLNTFDYLAKRFKHYFGETNDPDMRVRALNTFFYQKGYWNDGITFGYDDCDLHVMKLSNKFINGLIATKKGSCITLPMLYLIIGERLGFPIRATRLPYHFLLRYVPETPVLNFMENIEATNGGGYTPDKQYKKDFKVPQKAVSNGVYLRTLTKKEYIATLLLINANEWIVRKDLEKAKEYLELSMKYDSTFSSAMINYATIHLREAMMLEQKMNDEKQIEIVFYDIYAKNRAKNQTSPSSRLPSPLHQQFKISEPDFSAFQIPIESIFPEKKNSKLNHSIPQPSPLAQFPVNPELQISLFEISQRYAPLIQAKLEVHDKYKQKAEELGIVRDYPMSFFQISSKSLKQFQEKGTK